MPFIAERALVATRPLEINYAGQVLKGQILASRFTPEAMTAASREASVKSRAIDRERRPLVVAVEAAREAYEQAEANKIARVGTAPGAHTVVELQEKASKAEHSLYEAEDALAAFEDIQRGENIFFLSGEVADALESWDAEYESGVPVPLEKEAIANALPWQLIQEVYEAIIEASAPTKKPLIPSSSG